MTIRFLPNFPENPSNPARCHVPTGKIEINQSRWDFLSPEDRDFVLQHEIGHYAHQTYDESKADEYALQQLAMKKPYSLSNFIKSVRNVARHDQKRIKNAERNALKIAAENGSKKAKQLLELPFYANADGKKCWLFLVPIVIIATIIIIKKTK